ncbi:hypothetical protein [Streptomyces sp. HUCO-GS316]|uniref:hypothetical protein n=1 Tax=Streptomyces sp. HUCO-GS316 TaxID=2692198 RepID=UPI00301BF284
MIRSADIREWRNRDVVDPKQRRFGTLEAVHVDTASDEPAMATIQTKLPTRHRLVLAPLDDASSDRAGYVKVLLVLVAVVLGLIGAAAEDLGCLLVIGIVLFVADVAFFAMRPSRRAGRRAVR